MTCYEKLKINLKNYPLLQDLVNEKKLDIKDVPIITYCAHSKCDASEKLIHALYKSDEEKKWIDLKENPISTRLGKNN